MKTIENSMLWEGKRWKMLPWNNGLHLLLVQHSLGSWELLKISNTPPQVHKADLQWNTFNQYLHSIFAIEFCIIQYKEDRVPTQSLGLNMSQIDSPKDSRAPCSHSESSWQLWSCFCWKQRDPTSQRLLVHWSPDGVPGHPSFSFCISRWQLLLWQDWGG